MNAGIIGYGVYIPRYRLKVSEIAPVWGKEEKDIIKSLAVTEKSVAAHDEDTVTLAYEAAGRAIRHAGISPQEIAACFVGSESHPYAVNPTSTTVGELLGIGNDYLAADFEFACKAATAAMLAVKGLIIAKDIKVGLVIGSDTAQAKPHDILEYTASSAAAAFLLGADDNEQIASITDSASFSSDTPDFWRRDGMRYPSHGGRFTGQPAYFTHVIGAATRLFQKSHYKPQDFQYCVFHSPNGKFPRQVARKLGFEGNQLAPSLIVDKIGNPYSASSLLGLAAVLDVAKPEEKIFIVSYGSGAGSDGFILETTENLIKKRQNTISFAKAVSRSRDISYLEYLKFGGLI